MTDDDYDSRVDVRGGPVVREAWCKGIAAPVTIRWKRWREEPGSSPLFDVELDGPFGVVSGRNPNLFLALQGARHSADARGWILAVEGARPEARPAKEQPDDAPGSRVVRAGEEAQEPRDLLDPAPPELVAPAVDQVRRRDAWPAAERAHPAWSAGRDYQVLNADVSDQRLLWWGTAGGPSAPGYYARPVFTERLSAGIAAEQATLAEVQNINRFRRVRVDPGTDREYDGYPFPAPLRRIPARFEVDSAVDSSVLAALIPGARVFPVTMRGRVARLVILPRGVEYDDVAPAVEKELGSAIFDPMIFMRQGALRGTVRRAIR